jgi:hypothetical protein
MQKKNDDSNKDSNKTRKKSRKPRHSTLRIMKKIFSLVPANGQWYRPYQIAKMADVHPQAIERKIKLISFILEEHKRNKIEIITEPVVLIRRIPREEEKKKKLIEEVVSELVK